MHTPVKKKKKTRVQPQRKKEKTKPKRSLMEYGMFWGHQKQIRKMHTPTKNRKTKNRKYKRTQLPKDRKEFNKATKLTK